MLLGLSSYSQNYQHDSQYNWINRAPIFAWEDSLNLKNLVASDTVIQFNKLTGTNLNARFQWLCVSQLTWSCTLDLGDFSATPTDTFIISLGGTNRILNITKANDFDALGGVLGTGFDRDTVIVSTLAHNVNGVTKYTKTYFGGQNPYNFRVPMIRINRLHSAQATNRYIRWFFDFNHM